MKYAIAHIADIHYRKDEPEGVSTVLNSFINDLKKQKSIYSDHKFYIAISGDIVNAGSDLESYESFNTEISTRLDDIGLTKDFRIIVPGNHDIDRDLINKELANYKSKITQNIINEQKFNDFIDDYPIGTFFENYALFEDDFAEYGSGLSIRGSGWVVNDNLGFYCLNTALCSFGGLDNINDEGSIAIDTRSLVKWCNKNKNNINILLMHHPVQFLTEWGQLELKRIIENNFKMCLCGHRHKQDAYYNKISQESIVFSTPQLFTNKNDDIGYALILIDNSSIDKVVYRQYVNGIFLNGQKFAENDEGVLEIKNPKKKKTENLESKLRSALAFFKNQPVVFIEPKISKTREFNNEENLLHDLITNPQSSLITSPPNFGLTCLSHYMRLEAYKNNDFWLYLDAKHIKSRKLESEIDEQLSIFDETEDNVKCVILDSWDSSSFEHKNILLALNEKFKNIPLFIMSNYYEYNYKSEFDFNKLNRGICNLHLQALQRNKVRELVKTYSEQKKAYIEDEIVTKVVKDLEVLNVHRTPLNCLTLLKVIENKGINESLINRTELIDAVLFILFTDIDSFIYSSNKPTVKECKYILGKFCANLIKNKNTRFDSSELIKELKTFCDEQLMNIDVTLIREILIANNILISIGRDLEFKHRYWIFYFAAQYMPHDEEFRNYVFSNKNYVNFPEIIEFYTGIDGKKEDALQVLLNDTKKLIEIVKRKTGIKEDINPLDNIVWDPSNESIKAIKEEISKKIQDSNLPTMIKDQHADKNYNSEAPYDQSINEFLNGFSVVSLMESIKASSRALRNSNYVSPELKLNMFREIINGWTQISEVIFWLSPLLAHRGKVIYDGFCLVLTGNLKGDFFQKLKAIYLANPNNVLVYLKDDLSSKKIGPLLYHVLNEDIPERQKHLILLFLIKEKPDGWYNEVSTHMNLLHRNSFYLGNLYETLERDIKENFLTDKEIASLKTLASIVVAKHEDAPKLTKNKQPQVPQKMSVSKKNKTKIDKIMAVRNNKEEYRKNLKKFKKI